MVKIFIKRIIALNIIFTLIMTMYRTIFMFYYFNFKDLTPYTDLIKAFILGFRYDCAILAYINSLVTLSFIIFWFIDSKKLFIEFVKSLKYYYTIFFGIVVTLLCIDFGFYSYFQNHINILIFGIFEDDTKALASTICDNYPVFWVVLGFVVLYALIYFVTKKIMETNIAGFYYYNKTKIGYKILLALLVLSLNFIIARGSFGIFPLGVDNADISQNTLINKIAINGIYTLQVAIEARSKEKNYDYISKMGYKQDNITRAFSDYLNVDINLIDKNQPEQSIFKTTKYNKNIEDIKPNVIFIVMESLGTDLMHYNSNTFNVLGEFKKHLDQDTVFYRFIPSNMGTIGSLEGAITNILRLPLSRFLCQSKYAYNKYFFSGPMPYKNSGYETYFMYGGNTGWRNCSGYMPSLGFDNVLGEGQMSKEYERNQWGVYDEYLFDNIFETLKKNDNSKFIYVMTTSNHPPYSLPRNYKKPYQLEISKELEQNITGDMTFSKMRFATYQYSCQKVGEFLTKLKNSKFANNTIVAITGDHNFWITFTYPLEQKLDEQSVPFYLYIPKKLKPSKIDTTVVGSHTDILPTLYNLSLSNTKYWSMGQDLLADNAKNNIASNCEGIIMTKDNFVIYDFVLNKEKYYKWNKNKPREIVPCQQNQEHKNMVKHYKSGIAIAYYMLNNVNAVSDFNLPIKYIDR